MTMPLSQEAVAHVNLILRLRESLVKELQVLPEGPDYSDERNQILVELGSLTREAMRLLGIPVQEEKR